MKSETRRTQNGWGPMVQVALEQYYPPERRILDDPLVYRWLPAYLRLIVRAGGSDVLRERLFGLMDRKVPGVRGGILCRKRAIDDQLREALGDGLAAVVNLGAGMDTRAARLTDGLVVLYYEIDLAETMASKAAALRRVFRQVPAHIHLVAVDFERQDSGAALEAAGYQSGQRVFFIMEGVSQYITETAVRDTLALTSGAAPGSWLAFTYIRRDFLDGREMHGLEMLYQRTCGSREIWKFGLDPEEVANFIAPYGWREVEQLGSAEYLERYVRPAGRDIPVMAVERLVLAEKM